MLARERKGELQMERAMTRSALRSAISIMEKGLDLLRQLADDLEEPDSHGPTLRAPDAQGQTCPTCDGMGERVWNDGLMHICSLCNGSGQV